MNKTIYLRDEEGPIWERARELAGDKLSPVIVAALKRFIAEKEAEAKGFERLVVPFNDADDNWIPKKKAFYGRWIFPPIKALETVSGEGMNQKEKSFAVALTAKGAAVIYSRTVDLEGSCAERFRVYDSLEDAANFPDVNYAAIRAIQELGVPVEELDI